MTMNLMLAFATLIQQSELKQSPNIGALTGQRDENGDVNRAILYILPVGVEIDGPVVTADGEDVTADVLAGAHAFGE